MSLKARLLGLRMLKIRIWKSDRWIDEGFTAQRPMTRTRGRLCITIRFFTLPSPDHQRRVAGLSRYILCMSKVGLPSRHARTTTSGWLTSNASETVGGASDGRPGQVGRTTEVNEGPL